MTKTHESLNASLTELRAAVLCAVRMLERDAKPARAEAAQLLLAAFGDLLMCVAENATAVPPSPALDSNSDTDLAVNLLKSLLTRCKILRTLELNEPSVIQSLQELANDSDFHALVAMANANLGSTLASDDVLTSSTTKASYDR
jgi:hypothetical protein